jgi:hypothetical protein
MRATNADGSLRIIEQCKIITPLGTVPLRILPDISDSKNAGWASEPIFGRSSPMITFSHSDARTIQTDLHFMITRCQDITDNLTYLRILQSLVYPGASTGNVPFTPPPVSKIICGHLLASQGDGGAGCSAGVCVVMRSYNIRYPTDVAWDENDPNGDSPTYLPYKFTLSCSWEVVYACKDLPTNRMIAKQEKSWCGIIKV